MRFGVLHLTYPGGKREDFPLEQPTVVIGRASDNDLIVEDGSVSRRHARLTVDSGRLMVEDLGAANGTYLGGRRLAPNTPSLVPDGHAMRLGDVQIEYDAPEAVEAANAFAPPPAASAPVSLPQAPAGPSINASLSGPTQPVAPGAMAAATITLHNRGAVVDEFTLTANGLPPEWVKFSLARVPLLPNAQQAISLTIQPPRRADATAGEHAFSITVSAKEQGTSINLAGSLVVLPFQQLSLALQPVRAKRDFRVLAHNQGNTAVSLTFTGSDDEAALNYSFGQLQINLGPGESRGVPLQVTRRERAGLGARETRTFAVTALPAGGQAEAKTTGQLMVQSNFPVWIIPLLLILLLCACAGSVAGYATLCPTFMPNAPLCPALGVPVIRTLSVTPTEIVAGGTVVLAWDVSGGETVELTSPFQQTLAGSGTQSFVITQDTVFTLHASNPFGDRDSSVQVKVLTATATATRDGGRPTVETPTPTAPVTNTPNCDPAPECLTLTAGPPPLTPTPNGALGIFETQFEETVDLVFGASMGSQSVCAPHPLALGPGDVGKQLTVNILDYFAEAPEGDPAPSPPTAGLYRSLTGPWENHATVNLWDAPNAEEVAPNASPLNWVVTAAGDYVVCVEVTAVDYYGSNVAWYYVRYQLLLSGP